MKQYKRLTRLQKSIVQGHGLNPRDYRFVEQISESYIKIVNVHTGIQKTVDVYKRAKNKWDF